MKRKERKRNRKIYKEGRNLNRGKDIDTEREIDRDREIVALKFKSRTSIETRMSN
jgi:hypothetical protein